MALFSILVFAAIVICIVFKSKKAKNQAKMRIVDEEIVTESISQTDLQNRIFVSTSNRTSINPKSEALPIPNFDSVTSHDKPVLPDHEKKPDQMDLTGAQTSLRQGIEIQEAKSDESGCDSESGRVQANPDLI